MTVHQFVNIFFHLIGIISLINYSENTLRFGCYRATRHFGMIAYRRVCADVFWSSWLCAAVLHWRRPGFGAAALQTEKYCAFQKHRLETRCWMRR